MAAATGTTAYINPESGDTFYLPTDVGSGGFGGFGGGAGAGSFGGGDGGAAAGGQVGFSFLLIPA